MIPPKGMKRAAPPGATPPKDIRKPQTFSSAGSKTDKPPHIDFGTLFDLHYSQDNDTEKEARERGILSPSHGLTMEYACDRQCTLELLRAQKDPPKEKRKLAGFELLLKKTADNGEHRHAFIQHRFLKMAEQGFMGIQECHVESTLRHPTKRIKGSADILIKLNGYWYLIDIKTIGKKNAEGKFKPEKEHVLQLNAYMGLSGVRAAYIQHEIRDDLSWLQPASAFRVDFDPALWASTLALADHTTKHAEAKTLPIYNQLVCNRHKGFCKLIGPCEKELNGEDFLEGAEGLKSWP